MGAIMYATSGSTAEEYGGTFATEATEVAYDNTQSGLTADDMQDAIDEVYGKTQKQIYTLKWTADSTSSGGTHFTESKTIPKGKYLAIGKAPVMTVDAYACNVHGVSGELTSYIFLTSQKTESIIVEISGTSSEVYLESASSVANTFTYKERGGLWLIEL